MTDIRPFRGLRPRPDVAPEVASPPYDVLSSDEARELVVENPNSFLRVNKSEVDFPPDTDVHSEAVYLRGRENLDRLIAEGLMVRDESPCFYLYRLTWQGRSQTGIVSLASTKEYDEGLVKKHEHTRPVKVKDRADHIETLEAQVGPVFTIFRHTPGIERLFADATAREPEYDFGGRGDVRHELWVVDDEKTVDALVAAFAALPAIYVADGHHRSAAASEVARRWRERNPDHTGDEHVGYFLNVIFSDHETRILPYNRIVSGLNGLSVDELVSRVEEKFTVERRDAPVEPVNGYEYGMYVGGNWYLLRARPGTWDESDAAGSIDSAVLTANLLTPVLGIEDLRTDDRIDFVGGIRGVGELVRRVERGDADVAFSLYPATVAQLLAVADAGQVMPPKSTWFEPKLLSGMVVNLLKA